MLIELPNSGEPHRNPRREGGLWHIERQNALSIGCAGCRDRQICGGLHVARPVFDCTGLCCGNPADCDSVCRKKPFEFAQRLREIDGFALDNVPRASVLAAPALPKLVPTFFHGDSRVKPFKTEAACLPLYKVIERHDGTARYKNAEEVARGFTLSPGTQIILTGTATDRPLERWWSMGSGRREAIRALRMIGVALVTTPNFSCFIDRPRWDDMHSMKRIAIVHEEFLSEGLPAGLHLNARTDQDWSRWRDYIRERPEVTHIAFEFATGAGYRRRMQWHADHLVDLVSAAGRPLHLVVRGGGKTLPALAKAFAKITVLETSVFSKTVRRQKAVLATGNRVAWQKSPTDLNEPLDALLIDNWLAVSASYEGILNQQRAGIQAAV